MKLLSLIAILGMAALPGVPHKKPLTDRQLVLTAASGQVGVTEKTGRNDGPQVEAYLDAAGLAKDSGAPYCACFVYWSGKASLGLRNPYPKSAWSPDMVRGGVRVTESTVIRGAETFGIYFPAKGRVAHTGLVERREGSNLITIEGNTSGSAAIGSSADREGQGVFRKRRPWRTVYSVRDWLPR